MPVWAYTHNGSCIFLQQRRRQNASVLTKANKGTSYAQNCVRRSVCAASADVLTRGIHASYHTTRELDTADGIFLVNQRQQLRCRALRALAACCRGILPRFTGTFSTGTHRCADSFNTVGVQRRMDSRNYQAGLTHGLVVPTPAVLGHRHI